MVPAYGMAFLPQNHSTGNGRFQAAVSWVAWMQHQAEQARHAARPCTQSHLPLPGCTQPRPLPFALPLLLALRAPINGRKYKRLQSTIPARNFESLAHNLALPRSGPSLPPPQIRTRTRARTARRGGPGFCGCPCTLVSSDMSCLRCSRRVLLGFARPVEKTRVGLAAPSSHTNLRRKAPAVR